MKRVLWSVVWLAGCPWIGAERLEERYDVDGDGVPWPRDCDDGDPAVATEQTWPLDADGDGLGSPTETVTSCQRPADAVDNTEDCDDGDEAIGLPTAFWPDGDGDDYGDPAGEVLACLAPADHVPPGLADCDDGLAAVNPGATEVCENGRDDDCDGTPNDCGLPPRLDADEGSWVTLRGELAGDALGRSLATGDLTGDGIADLALSRARDGGYVLVLQGPLGDWDPAGGAAVDVGEVADVVWPDPSHGDFGYQVRIVDGLLGGQGALVVGAPGADPIGGPNAGALLLYELTGGAPMPSLVVHGAAEDGLGFRVVDLGATDGAGPDLGFTLFRDSGEVRVVDGPLAAGDVDVDDLGARLSLVRAGTSAWFTSLGLGLASVDLDADGVREILLSDPFNGGGVWGVPGDLTGRVTVDEHPNLADPDGTALGWSIASAGDFDGDGYEDAVIGEPYHEAVPGDARGAVHLLWGASDGSLATWRLEGAEGAGLGFSVAGLGDHDGDGFGDVLYASGGGTTSQPEGYAEVLYGRAGTPDPLATTRIAPLRYADAGETIFDLGHGDLDDDGVEDLVVPDFPWVTDGGAVHVIRGIGW